MALDPTQSLIVESLGCACRGIRGSSAGCADAAAGGAAGALTLELPQPASPKPATARKTSKQNRFMNQQCEKKRFFSTPSCAERKGKRMDGRLA